jgi:hypothetical protein
MPRFAHRLMHAYQHALFLALGGYLWLLDSPLAWAAKKKTEAPVEAGKSYTFPYIIVMAVMAVGLMTVLRPSKRLETALNMHTKEEK